MSDRRTPAHGEEVMLLTGETAAVKRYERDMIVEGHVLNVVSLQKPCRQEFANVEHFHHGFWHERERQPDAPVMLDQLHVEVPPRRVTVAAKPRRGTCPRCAIPSAPGNAHNRRCRNCGQDYGTGVLSTQLLARNANEGDFWMRMRAARITWFGRLVLRIIGL